MNDPASSTERSGLRIAAGVLASGILIIAGLLVSDVPREWLLGLRPEGAHQDTLAVDRAELERAIAGLRRQIDRKLPGGAYLVVSSTDNRFTLMRGADTLRTGLCSTGSYVKLEASDGRTWLFRTPRGAHRVLGKRVNPIWSKPDWAFIEAGEEVPSAGSSERFERGVLGRFAMDLGDGYLVHGTPYQRLLGLPVTHGCVRLGDLDLAATYQALAIGSPVYLY